MPAKDTAEITGEFAPWFSETDALAMASERFRPIMATLLKTPKYRRRRVFFAWLKQQPNPREILAAIMATDASGPPPGFPTDAKAN